MKDLITQLTICTDITLITLANVPYDTKIIADIFDVVGKAGLNIDMISITPPYKGIINVSFTINDTDLFNTLQTLKTFKNSIPNLRLDVNSNNCKLSLYGKKMKTAPGTAAKTMKLLSEENIDIKLITTSEVDISYLIYSSDQKNAVNCIKEYFGDNLVVI